MLLCLSSQGYYLPVVNPLASRYRVAEGDNDQARRSWFRRQEAIGSNTGVGGYKHVRVGAAVQGLGNYASAGIGTRSLRYWSPVVDERAVGGY